MKEGLGPLSPPKTESFVSALHTASISNCHWNVPNLIRGLISHRKVAESNSLAADLSKLSHTEEIEDSCKQIWSFLNPLEQFISVLK